MFLFSFAGVVLQFLAVLLLSLLAAASPGRAQGILIGYGRAVDGDDIQIGQVRVRLCGIDAFEHSQKCGPGRFSCGRAAHRRLAELVRGRLIICTPQKVKGRRIYANCLLRGKDGRLIDPAADLVSRGLAIAYRYYSRRYAAQEVAACRARVGAWGTGLVTPPFCIKHPRDPACRPGRPTAQLSDCNRLARYSYRPDLCDVPATPLRVLGLRWE